VSIRRAETMIFGSQITDVNLFSIASDIQRRVGSAVCDYAR